MPDSSQPITELRAALTQANARWQADLTTVAALPTEQRLLRLGYVPGPGEPTLQQRERIAAENLRAAATAAPGAPAFPSSHDWRNVAGSNYVTPIRDQGGCGSCVAFGACATVECTTRVQENDPSLAIDLSEAQLFYCIARSEGRMCGGPNGGWWVPPAMDGFESDGIADESCYPYSAGDQNCTNLCDDWKERATHITGYHEITSHDDMKTWLSTRGALSACFTVYDDFFSYSSGIYHHVSGDVAGGHCVSVVGYDDAGGFWICKNSWGSAWGESGFFCIAYGECGIDSVMWAVDGVTLPETLGGRIELFVRGTDNAMYHMWQTSVNDGWSGWAGFGGILTSDPVFGRNADGRLEIFVRGSDNGLYHIWQTAPNNGWSGWGGLGGVILGDPAVVNDADGRLEVFAIGTDNALYHIWQTAPNNGWSSWASLGGGVIGTPTASRNDDGRIEIFVRGMDNALWHIWQTAPNNGWSGWASLGGILTSDAAVVNNADGRLEVFGLGTDNALYHIWQTAPNNGWSGWAGLGGVLTSELACARNEDGRIEVFGRGTDNGLYHIWQTAPNNGWSGWAGLGGVITSRPTVVHNADGRLEVFARGTDNGLYHIWQTAPNNGWSGWAGLGGILTSAIAAGQNG
jgi:C1A family cysteine protease/acylphosphatase